MLLTHRCFADDILILTDGLVGAPKETLETFQCFYNLSSIILNPMKTAMYPQEMVQLSGFKRGSPPVKYLGLPLIPWKLSEADCEILIERLF